MAGEQERHGHGHGHHHEEPLLDRIGASVGRQEKAWQRNEARIIEMLAVIKTIGERVSQMPVSQEVTDALEAVRSSLRGAAAKEHEEFLAAMQTQADAAAAKVDELTAKIDELIAKGGTASADEVQGIKDLATEVDTAVDSIVPAAAPPLTGRR